MLTFWALASTNGIAPLHSHTNLQHPTIPLFALTKGYRSKRQLSKSFTVVIQPLLTRLIKPKFCQAFYYRTIQSETNGMILLFLVYSFVLYQLCNFSFIQRGITPTLGVETKSGMMNMITMITEQVDSATGRVGSATRQVGSVTGRVVTLKGHRITVMTQGRMIMTVWTKMQMKTAKWTMTRRRKKISMMNYGNSKWKMTRKLW